jgi:hypothetical protein
MVDLSHGHRGVPLAVGRITLRRDGWFSLDSSSLLGVLTTTPILSPPKPRQVHDDHNVEELELVSKQRPHSIDTKLSRSLNRHKRSPWPLAQVLVLNLLSSVRGVVRASLLDPAVSAFGVRVTPCTCLSVCLCMAYLTPAAGGGHHAHRAPTHSLATHSTSRSRWSGTTIYGCAWR